MSAMNGAKRGGSISDGACGELSQTMLQRHARIIMDHLWGPTGSILLHILLVALLFRYLVWEIPQEKRDEGFVYQGVPSEPKILEPIDTRMEDFDSTPADDLVFQSPILPSEVMDDHLHDLEMPVLGEPIGMYEPLAPGGPIESDWPPRRPPINEEIAQGMNMALEWLKEHQRPDGSWISPAHGNRGVTAVTALALMAFISYGETPASPAYGETVRKAIEYLLREQERHGPAGAFSNLDQQGVYAHGIATYAISETFAATLIPSLRESMDAAVQHIIQGQQPGGGFDYHFNQGTRRDTSVAGWMVQAMRAAYMAGSQVEGLSEAIELSAADIKRAALPDGRFSYTANDPHPSSTAIGALCLQLTGHSRDTVVVSALSHLRAHEACSWSEYRVDRAMYHWFYTTQVMFHHGGAVWSDWERQMLAEYLRVQAEDGHWYSPGNEHVQHGYAYTTALGALTLQIPLRKALLFQTEAIRHIPRSITEDEGNEQIRIEVEFI